ncbi:MAG: Nramp family divalent metal transporter [Thermoguttaceae bacterium]|jgi:Mn2+/Fe2+ NRAMP family transporter|nr:Nramp family divalent metal transporter [Thermoguttaceae bacterium]
MDHANEGHPDSLPLVRRPPWWKSLGPALITACVVFGAGSLTINSKAGATFGYDMLWMLPLTGLLMGTYVMMGARIGVCGGATPCTLVAQRVGRPFAALVGLTLFATCTTFQFAGNTAVAFAASAFVPMDFVPWIVVGVNAAIIVFLFAARHIYKVLERTMKVMVGVILLSFAFNLVAAGPNVASVLRGLVPKAPTVHEAAANPGDDDVMPHGLSGAELPLAVTTRPVTGAEMVLIASMLGTTFSVAGAFFQGNLVREKGWEINDYRQSITDSIAGVSVLTGASMIIMITAGTVLLGNPVDNPGELALSLRPLLGPAAYWLFCIGLVAVALNPFLINAMIGGTIAADGLGMKARMSDTAPRLFTVAVLLIGMSVALFSLLKGGTVLNLLIFGQALTVLGNPLMAGVMLWLANRTDVMGPHRNKWWINVLGVIGFLVVLGMAAFMAWRVYGQLVPSGPRAVTSGEYRLEQTVLLLEGEAVLQDEYATSQRTEGCPREEKWERGERGNGSIGTEAPCLLLIRHFHFPPSPFSLPRQARLLHTA